MNPGGSGPRPGGAKPGIGGPAPYAAAAAAAAAAATSNGGTKGGSGPEGGKNLGRGGNWGFGTDIGGLEALEIAVDTELEAEETDEEAAAAKEKEGMVETIEKAGAAGAGTFPSTAAAA